MATEFTKQSPRVLIVEDEQRYRELLLHALPDMGFDGAGAGSAEQALRMMAEQPHQILVLDLNLPGMGGLELLEKVRQRWPQSRVVILTGFGDLETAKQAIRLDVDDFLTKPCHLGELEKALERARRSWSQQQPDAAARAPAANEPAPPAPPASTPHPTPPAQPGGPTPTNHDKQAQAAATLDEIERQHILAALARHDGNREATATELGISVRTLYYRLAQYQKQGYL